MTETIDENTEFGSGHMFSVGSNELLIRRKTIFKTEIVQAIPLDKFIKIEFVNPFDKKNISNTLFSNLLGGILSLFAGGGSGQNSVNGEHVSVEYKVGEDIALSHYYTKFKGTEFEELQNAIHEGKKQLIT